MGNSSIVDRCFDMKELKKDDIDNLSSLVLRTTEIRVLNRILRF